MTTKEKEFTIVNPNKMQYTGSTKDYEKFILIKENRAIHEPTVKELVKSIESVGFVSTITVRKSKRHPNKYEVIDGQNRLEAAKRIGVEVNYTVYIGLSKSNISQLQILKGWGLDDFLHYGVEIGLSDYIFLNEVRKTNKLPLTALILMFGGGAKYSNKEFKSMKWKAISKPAGFHMIECLKDFGRRNVPLWKSARFIWGFALVYNSKTADYDHKRMLRHIDKASMMLTKQASPNDYARNIQQLYNHGVSAKNKVRFVQ